MVKVRPFKGFLPSKQLFKKIVAPEYDVISTDEARNMAYGNDYSFLHVNKPEIDLPRDTDPYSS